MITQSVNCHIPVERSDLDCCLRIRACDVHRNNVSTAKSLEQAEMVLHGSSVSVGCKREEVECGEGTPTARVGVVVQPQLDGTKGALGLFSVLRIVNYNWMTRTASKRMNRIRWAGAVVNMAERGGNEVSSTARSIWHGVHGLKCM